MTGASTVRSAIGWSSLVLAIQQLLSLFTVAILARLLSPAELGVSVAAQSAVGFVAMFLSVGLGVLVVTHTTDDQRWFSSLHWLSVATHVLAGVVTAAAAAALAALTGVSSASGYIVLLAASLPPLGWAVVPMSILRRRAEFRRLAVVLGTQSTVYSAVAISMAVGGWGTGAIVVGLLVANIAQAVTATALSRWRPLRAIDRSGLLKHTGFTAQTSLSNVAGYLYNNVDYWVVARIGDAGSVGTYYIAYALPSLVRQRFSALAASVVTPILGAAIREGEDVRDRVSRGLEVVALVSWPTFIGIALVAEPLVETIFGPRWSAAAPLLEILAVALLFEVVGFLRELYWMLDRARTWMVLEWVRLVIFAIGLAGAAALQSLIVVAFAALGASVVRAGMLVWSLGAMLDLPRGPVLRSLVWPAPATFGMVGATELTGMLLETPPLLLMAVQVLVGAATFLILAALFTRWRFRRTTGYLWSLRGKRVRPGSTVVSAP